MNNKKAPGRKSLKLAVLCRGFGFEFETFLRNISAQGARIEPSPALPHGTLLSLSSGDLTAEGSVVWSERGALGIVFAYPVSTEDWLNAHLTDGLIAAVSINTRRR